MSKKRNVVLFIASSLDGYIAAKEDSLEWLFKVEGEGDNGYSEFYETVDTVLLGKRTYDWIMKQDLEEFPYQNIIGNGIPLFKEGDHQLDLLLKGTRTFNQFVELHYDVKK